VRLALEPDFIVADEIVSGLDGVDAGAYPAAAQGNCARGSV